MLCENNIKHVVELLPIKYDGFNLIKFFKKLSLIKEFLTALFQVNNSKNKCRDNMIHF